MRKTGAVNREKYGEDFYQRIGAMGGSAKVKTKGFGSATPEQRREWGSKGGKMRVQKRAESEKANSSNAQEES